MPKFVLFARRSSALIVGLAAFVVGACDSTRGDGDALDADALPQLALKEGVEIGIAGGPNCRECAIERYLVAEIDESRFPGAISRVTRMTAASDGRILLGSSGNLPVAHVATADGRVVRRIGQQGSGPGEYRSADQFMEFGSGYLIFDRQLRRVTVLSTEFEFERVVPMPPLETLNIPLTLPDGRYVVNGVQRSQDGFSEPLHIIDHEGTVTRSFGGRLPLDGPVDGAWPRAVAMSADGTLLVAGRRTYRIERWDTAGTLLHVYEREAEWFPPRRTDVVGEPRISQIYEDDDGLLWVQMNVFTPGAAPDFTRTAPGHMIVEVLDLARARVVFAARTDAIGGEVDGGGPMHRYYAESEIGEPILRVWGLRLRRPD